MGELSAAFAKPVGVSLEAQLCNTKAIFNTNHIKREKLARTL